MIEPTCLRCQTKMETGLIVDDFHSGMHKEQEWAAGPPKHSWWTGLNLSGKERHNVTTYRCPRCGYLESYAPQESRGSHGKSQASRHCRQATIQCQKGNSSDPGGRQEMDIHPPQAKPMEVMTFQEGEYLVRLDSGSLRQRVPEIQELRPVAQVAARQLSDDARMAHDFSVLEQIVQSCIPAPEVINPD